MDPETRPRGSNARGLESMTPRGESEHQEGPRGHPMEFQMEAMAVGKVTRWRINGDEDPRAWRGESTEMRCLGARVTKGPENAQEASRSWYEPRVRLARL
jgi:hypothetical protein